MISNSVQADGDTNIILQMIEYDRKHNVVTFGKIPQKPQDKAELYAQPTFVIKLLMVNFTLNLKDWIFKVAGMYTPHLNRNYGFTLV